MQKEFRYSVVGILFLATIFLQMYLLDRYPYTGLGRIVSIPFNLVMVLVLSVVLNTLLKEMSYNWKSITLCLVFLGGVILLTIFLWPQDGGPFTWEQVFKGVKRESSF